MKIDYLIVGQGLAGTIMARTLQKRGCRIIVVDQFRENTASKVAAGLINPIAGKRVSLSWKANEFVPAAHTFYTDLEEFLKSRFYYPLPLVRLFSSIEDQNNWMAKSADPQVGQFLEEDWKGCQNPVINSAFGGIKVALAGYVNLPEMLENYRLYLTANHLLLNESFEFEELHILDSGIQYKHISAKAVIFCEGYKVQHNPYFGWVPVVPTKGEVIDLENEDLELTCLYNKAVYMVPQGKGKIRVGATYDWRNPNEETTEAGVAELTEKAAAMVNLPLNVTAKYAGIRPAVRDRKPLIGLHPKYQQIIIFNGMGSKGVMMAPFFAWQLADMLLNNSKLYHEADISRYYSLFPATH